MTFFKPYHNSIKRLVIALFAGSLASLVSLPVAAAETSAETDSVAMENKAMMEKTVMMEKKAMMANGSSHGDIANLQVCNPNGVALAGIDVVSYHNPTGPLMGNSDYTALHEGLTYRFLSEEHLQLFVAAPETYLPSYLGWCATSMAAGALTCPNPLNYKLEDGKLLLFETTGFTNGQNLWNADPLQFRRRADRHRDDFLDRSAETAGL